MKNGFRVIDMDTHVSPSYDVLTQYVDPEFRPRLAELTPYLRKVPGPGGAEQTRLSIGAIPFDRFPGTAPRTEDDRAAAGGRSALDGRTISLHRGPTQLGVEDQNSDGRIHDMNLEGRDIDFIFPTGWNTSSTGLEDVTLAEGLYHAYHRYMSDYTYKYPDRLKTSIQVPGGDVEWAVSEVKTMAKERWASAVWVHLPTGMPVDHPQLEPLWATMNDLDLPLIHHSFFATPPYFPGYRDIWGNTLVARTAAHPWGASRLCAYLIVSGILDRYPNFRAAVCEVGHGWLPNWIIRLGFHLSYIQGATPDLKYTPLEYVQQGRFRCGAELYEGADMTEACLKILGTNCLMHQSDYPHGQCYFPESTQMALDWPFWSRFSEEDKRKYMSENAASFLRLV